MALTAPIKEPAKTVSALLTKIDGLISQSSARGDLEVDVRGNAVRLRACSPTPQLGAKLLLFVHNPGVDARALLDDACALPQRARYM